MKCDWMIHGIGRGMPCECCGEEEEHPPVYHTHGLARHNNGLELELNLPCDGEKAMQIINTIGFALANGEVTLSNGCTEETLFTLPFRYVVVNAIDWHEEGEKVMRIVTPDENGKFPGDGGVNPWYDMQLLPGEGE